MLSRVDPALFSERFGTDLSQAQTLIEANTLTISKLMTIMPQGHHSKMKKDLNNFLRSKCLTRIFEKHVHTETYNILVISLYYSYMICFS